MTMQLLKLDLPKADLVLPFGGRKLKYCGPLNLTDRKIPAWAIKKAAQYTNGIPVEAVLKESGGERLLASGVWEGSQNFLVIASLDDTERFGPLLHLSLSYPKRDPTWNEIKAVRYSFYPASMDVMMVLPADEDYINLHQHCFQMWQCPERWQIR